MKIEFPGPANIRLYYKHLSFLKNLFELAKYNITINTKLNDFPLHSSVYLIRINNKYALIDTHDGDSEYFLTRCGDKSNKRYYNPKTINIPVFKAQLRPTYINIDKVFPFTPMYVVDNTDHYLLRELYSRGNIYNIFKSNNILHTNRIHGNARKTRGIAFNLIKNKKLNKNIKFIKNRVPVEQHYNRHSNILASLNISGATKNTLDAGPLESMFLGACVIGNNFDTVLTGNNILTGDKHYIKLKDDYSDINEKINYVYENKSICKDIANEGYELVLQSCTPKPVSNWIINNVEDYYLKNPIPTKEEIILDAHF